MLSRAGLPSIGSFEAELCWTTQALLYYSSLIDRFVQKKHEAERLFLRGDSEGLENCLTEISTEFGVSIWLVERRLNALQEFRGYKDQDDYARGLMETTRMGGDAKYLLSWMRFRAGQNVSPTEFSRLLSDILPLKTGYTYLVHSFLGECPFVGRKDAAEMLSYADSLPVIDRYLMMLTTVQIFLASRTVDPPTLEIIKRNIGKIRGRVADPALTRLLVACGTRIRPAATASDCLRPLESYTRGEYPTAIAESESSLAEEPCIDTLHVRLRAIERSTTAGSELKLYFPGGPGAKAEADLWKIVTFAKDAADATVRLEKLVSTNVSCSWACSLGLIVERRLHDDRIFSPTRRQTFLVLRADRENPNHAFAFASPEIGQLYLESLFPNFVDSLTCRTIQALLRPDDADPDLWSAMPDDRADRMRAIRELRGGRAANTIRLLRRTLPPAEFPTSDDLEAGLILAEAYLRERNLHDCSECCADLFIASEYTGRMMPVQRLTDALIEWANGTSPPNRHILGHLPTVIIFDLMVRFVSPSREPERADAFNDFLEAQDIRFPSEIGGTSASFNRNQLAYFLRNVCVPEVLDQSLALGSTLEVENERAKAIILLSELIREEGKPPPPDLTDELRQIKTHQIIRQMTLQLDRSKIYVNIDGIKRALSVSMKENWHRYKLLLLQQDTGKLDEIQRLFEKIVGDKLRVVTVNVGLPQTEAGQLFRNMVQEIFTLFASSKEFGLDSYLSTNIRHGYTLRELRGPFVVHHLVTNRATESGGYQPNVHWDDRCRGYGNDLELQGIQKALACLSSRVDEVIERINRKLIRIKSDKSPDGLFSFDITTIQLNLLQRRCDAIEEYEEFVGVVMDILWGLTNASLEVVRNVLVNDIWHDLQHALEELQIELDCLGSLSSSSGLIAAINLARPDIRAAVERIASWFVPSNNSEFADYPLKLAFEASLATVKSYYRDLDITHNFWEPTNLVLAGWTLPSFARLFLILIENAAFHCGVGTGGLDVVCEATLNESWLEIILRNSLSSGVDRDKLGARLARINANFNREGAFEAIDNEGGSGYPKIFRLLTYDLSTAHELAVRLTEGEKFEVRIKLDARELVK
jgi:hypothetical protein